MILSASRRTDLPAFYAEWFIRRIRQGHCAVANPLNPSQVTRVSLAPEDVEAIVFWTRSPRALMRHLPELDARGFRYYFQFSLLGYPREIEPQGPSVAVAFETFRRLADRVGPDRVIWRYDPIFWSNRTGADYHRRNFERLARALGGHTRRCVVSVWDHYRKLNRRLEDLEHHGIQARQPRTDELEDLLPTLAGQATAQGMEIVSCAEEVDLTNYGIRPGKCIDDALIQRLFGTEVDRRKDPSQRAACGCVQSRDIGVYDTCLFGCAYCYATRSFAKAAQNHRQHKPDTPLLLPPAAE